MSSRSHEHDIVDEVRQILDHHASDDNPYRRNRFASVRRPSGDIDLENPTAQRSLRSIGFQLSDGREDRHSSTVFQHAESHLAAEGVHQEQDPVQDHGQHADQIRSFGPPQRTLTGSTHRFARLHFGKNRPRDEEDLEKVLHNSIKHNKPLSAQSGLTGLARLARSFGLTINRDIKAPLAAIGVSSITIGPLLKLARKEKISIFRYGRESNSRNSIAV